MEMGVDMERYKIKKKLDFEKLLEFCLKDVFDCSKTSRVEQDIYLLLLSQKAISFEQGKIVLEKNENFGSSDYGEFILNNMFKKAENIDHCLFIYLQRNDHSFSRELIIKTLRKALEFNDSFDAYDKIHKCIRCENIWWLEPIALKRKLKAVENLKQILIVSDDCYGSYLEKAVNEKKEKMKDLLD